MWEKELAEMRDRIKKLRTLLAETMNRLQNKHDFGFINQQRGMFSFSGLAPDQGRSPQRRTFDLHRSQRSYQRRRAQGSQRRTRLPGDRQRALTS